ncbi:MAG TPA: helix-turn-helix domain-containing protein [Solirubrobacteraceae bacterium]|jgi:DNA-binding IclR family transcriptional regulator
MSSPAVDRAIRILDFLATHPAEQFTLSELSRRLMISKATAHGVLATLAAKGYVQRHGRSQTYRLGPALVPLGAVTERTLPAVEHGHAQIRALAGKYDVESSLSFATETEIVIIAHEGVPRPLGITGQAGQRLPLVPPFGVVFMAWEAPERVSAWLRRLGPRATPEELARSRNALAAVRRRGWAFALRTEAQVRLAELYSRGPDEIHTSRAQAELDRVMADFARSGYLDEAPVGNEDAAVQYISAPVFGPEGTMVLAMNIVPGDGFSARDLPELGEALRRAAGEVTLMIHGRRPEFTYDGDSAPETMSDLANSRAEGSSF